MKDKGVFIGDFDQGKVSLQYSNILIHLFQVTLHINLSFADRMVKKQEQELKRMKHLCEKYGKDDFAVYG